MRGKRWLHALLVSPMFCSYCAVWTCCCSTKLSYCTIIIVLIVSYCNYRTVLKRSVVSRSVSHSDVSLELMQDMRTEHGTCDAAVVRQKRSSAVSADIYQACMCPASATQPACSSAVIKATPGGVNVAARRPGFASPWWTAPSTL